MLNSIEEIIAANSLLGYLRNGVLPFDELQQQSRFMVFMDESESQAKRWLPSAPRPPSSPMHPTSREAAGPPVQMEPVDLSVKAPQSPPVVLHVPRYSPQLPTSGAGAAAAAAADLKLPRTGRKPGRALRLPPPLPASQRRAARRGGQGSQEWPAATRINKTWRAQGRSSADLSPPERRCRAALATRPRTRTGRRQQPLPSDSPTKQGRAAR
ncbi:uncharacterized protein LOC124545795 [Schistocerca americana]|uniref:uncharacterized protein LOC124545795 n=1 Tax=Schistocerca americana TaxID=7009 RepID=UPI001F4F7640|nr:uncharacterized protein LOC124545795 [Schistocerca americana]